MSDLNVINDDQREIENKGWWIVGGILGMVICLFLYFMPLTGQFFQTIDIKYFALFSSFVILVSGFILRFFGRILVFFWGIVLFFSVIAAFMWWFMNGLVNTFLK